MTNAGHICITTVMRGGNTRLEGTKPGTTSPLLVLRFPAKFQRMLKRAAKARKIRPSALAREILEKALEAEEKRR